MPFRISDKLLNSSIYLYPDQTSAEAGERIGGSGFIVGLPLEGVAETYTMWAVTNRHVIEQGHWTIRVNTKAGGTTCTDTDDTEWFFHPDGDDLAVRWLGLPDEAQANFVPLEMMLTKADAEILDVGPGDMAFVVGRFVASDGRQKNTPVVRFGQISQVPAEEVEYDHYRQKMWLVEVKSLNGYSGSPAFCYLDTHYHRSGVKPIAKPDDPEGHKIYDHRGNVLAIGKFHAGPYLLGVDCCMIPLWQKVCDSGGQEMQGGMAVPLNTGMMGVIPAWRLVDMLLANPVKAKIEEAALEELRRKAEAIPTAD